MRVSIRAVIFDKEKESVLLMFRKKLLPDGVLREYYSLPGGGRYDSESFTQTLERELLEELNVEVRLLGYLGFEEVPQGFSNYYHAEISGGTPKLGGEEKEKNSPENYYEIRYVKISDLENLQVFGEEFIFKALRGEYPLLDNAALTNQNICPTCYDRAFERVIFGDVMHMTLYEDDLIEALFVSTPRKRGHTILCTKAHYKDMTELDEELTNYVFSFARKLMKVLKETLKAESVYLVSMCDGPNNHFHLQFLPRYEGEKRGSENLVKSREKYIHDNELVTKIRRELLK